MNTQHYIPHHPRRIHVVYRLNNKMRPMRNSIDGQYTRPIVIVCDTSPAGLSVKLSGAITILEKTNNSEKRN